MVSGRNPIHVHGILIYRYRDCPKCKTKRRASKILSLARLPPILLIHLKRFEVHGRFSDKIDTFVDFPMKSLDLTNLMPAPLPPGIDKSQVNGGLPQSLEDPRTQLPPYRYDLYGVTDHVGNLTSGHCAYLSCAFHGSGASMFVQILLILRREGVGCYVMIKV
jgi:ubiquitin C-terminal hydrolase